MKKFIVCMSALICVAPNAPASPPPIEGSWLSEDKDSVILIEKCAHQADKYCGYLTHYKPSGDKLGGRALCGFRLMGGFEMWGGKLTDGWLLDIETDEVYHADIKLSDAPSKLEVTLYEKIKILSLTVKWTRVNLGNDTVKPRNIPPHCTP